MRIVFDKSFLDGAPTEQIRRLCEDHLVLFPESLFFELITTSKESQKRCFSKLPAIANPVTLIPNVGSLINFEIENQVACIPLEERALSINFKFNEKLREGTYKAEENLTQTLLEWEEQVSDETENFLKRCSDVHAFFPELNGIEWKTFPMAINSARNKVATDHEFVKSLHRSFLKENPRSTQPLLIHQNWAIFRWIQCQLLSALRMFGRYQGVFNLPASQGISQRAEHTMLDIDYVILAALSGALASGDKEIIDDFQLICPDGVLIAKELRNEVL